MVRKPLVVFSVLFLFNSLWIWQGLDMMDEGYYLTTQREAIEVNGSYSLGASWLSDMIGGAWQKVAGDPGLVWTRIGWAFIVAATGVTAFLMLSSLLDSPINWGLFLACSILINGGVMVMSYDTITPLFSIFSCGLWLIAQNKGGFRGFTFSAIGGIFAFLAFCSKVSEIPIFLVPCVFITTELLITKKVKRQAVLNLFWYFGGALLSCLLILGFIQKHGLLKEYLAFVHDAYLKKGTISATHDPAGLIKSYVFGSIVALGLGVISLSLGLWGLHLIAKIRSLRTGYFYVLFGLFFLLIISLYPLFRVAMLPTFPALTNLDYPLTILGVTWLLGLLCIYTLLRRDSCQVQLPLLILGGIASTVFAFWGSNVGIGKGVNGIWLLFPSLVVLINRNGIRVPERVLKTIGASQLQMTKCTIIALAMLTIPAFATRFTNPDRQIPNRLTMISEIKSQKTRGILSTSKTAEDVGSLLSEIRCRTRPNDFILAFPHVPMLYYLSDTRPAFNSPWLNVLEESDVRSRIVDFKKQHRRLAIIVEGKVNHQYYSSRISTLIENEIISPDYKKVWENSEYRIYAPH